MLPKIDSIKWECRIEMMNGKDKSNATEMPIYFYARCSNIRKEREPEEELNAYISVYAILIDKQYEVSEIIKNLESKCSE
jgi:hypothetical protein